MTTAADTGSDDRIPWLRQDRPFLGARRRGRRRLALDLVDAGLRILERDGPKLAGDQLTLAAALNELNACRPGDDQVSPGSVYDRLWSNPEDYRVDVLSAALYQWFSSNTTPQQEQIAATVGAALENADLSTEAGRWDALRDVIRLASHTSVEASLEYRPAQVRVAILAALAAAPDDGPADRQLREAARIAHDETTESYVELYAMVLGLLQLRPKKSVFGPTDTAEERRRAVEIFTRIIITYNDGADIRRPIEILGTDELTLPTGPCGRHERWNQLGLGVWAIARALAEPDTAPPPSTEL